MSVFVRKNILALKPYSSARDEFKGRADVLLDANENPFDHKGMERYPGANLELLKEKWSAFKGIPLTDFCFGAGSDELLDIIFKIYINAGDSIAIHPPTFGMYQVLADVYDAHTIEIPLSQEQQLDVEGFVNSNAKIAFICNPNNPTGTEFAQEDLLLLIQNFKGIVVVDEAYIDFANYSMVYEINKLDNLIVLQTFSKAWGMAGARCGVAYANADIINYFQLVKLPYNVSSLTINTLLEVLDKPDVLQKEIQQLLEGREILNKYFTSASFVKKVYPSAANFVLVELQQPQKLYEFLISKKILVRNQVNKKGCENSLRFGIGTPQEVQTLIEHITTFYTTK